jgi:hypothetical protein
MQRASVPIKAQAASRRLFMNSMMPFTLEDIDHAKEMIADFVEKFRARLSCHGWGYGLSFRDTFFSYY